MIPLIEKWLNITWLFIVGRLCIVCRREEGIPRKTLYATYETVCDDCWDDLLKARIKYD